MRRPFHSALTVLHRWSGLTVGLVVVAYALTGTGLLAAPYIERWSAAAVLTVPACRAPLALDRLAATARARHGGHMDAIEVSADPTRSVAVEFRNDDHVYLDPCSGAVLGVRNRYGGFFGTIDWLHRFKFLPGQIGRTLGGAFDLVFLTILIGGGIVLWWPRSRKFLRQVSTYNPRLRGRARLLNLHRVVGLYSTAMLLLITMTALPIAFQPVRTVLADALHSRATNLPPPALTAMPHAKRLPLQALWQRTRAAVPTLAWASLHLPAPHSAVMKAEVLERGAPHENAKSYLYLDAQSGRTLRLDRYGADMPAGRKLYLYLLALHSGLVGGLGYQLLLLAALLCIPVQFYTGARAWLIRRFSA